MERIGFIEILDRRGRARERVRLERFPTTLGRGYANDVILPDRYVSPEHCRIVLDESGELLVEDLASLNGVVVLPSAERRTRLRLRSGDCFRLGETTLRYVEAEHPIAPAERLPGDSGGFLNALRGAPMALGVVALSFAGLALEFHHYAYYGEEGVSDTVLGFGLLALWAGIWSFVNRLVTHRFDYLRHLAWVSLVILAFVVASTLSEYVRFLFSTDELAAAMDLAALAAVVSFLFGGHLAIVPASTRRARGAWALALGVLFVALLGLFEGQEDTSVLPFEMPLKSVGAAWAPVEPVDAFLARARETKDAVDALARDDH